MTRDWKEAVLGELIEIKHGFAFKGEFITEKPTNNILLTPGNFAIGGGFQWGKLKYYDGPIPSDYILTEGDLVVTMTDLSKASDTLGYSALVPPSEQIILHNQRTGKVINKKNSVDLIFLNYQLRTKTFRNEVLASATGSVIKHTSPTKICAYRFQLPPLAEQKAIASVLGALDEKIENNRRMNETLEEMVLAIFKSWFVDFDPVHVKASGNAPAHMDATTSALFPSSFGNDGLPTGWREEPLYNIATFINGAAYKNMHFCDQKDGLPVIKIIELKNGISAQTKFTNTDLGAKYKITSGEIFFAWSGSPHTSIDTFIWPYGEGWLNQHIFAIKENGFANLAYLYFQMKTLNPKFIAIATDKQTTGLGHVTVRNMKEMLVISAPDKIKKQFEQIATPIFEKIKLNLSESQTLAELRDTLLPKLMSGEIRIKDAEQEVEAIA
jgi:type I restriction enzyme, S subunit